MVKLSKVNSVGKLLAEIKMNKWKSNLANLKKEAVNGV